MRSTSVHIGHPPATRAVAVNDPVGVTDTLIASVIEGMSGLPTPETTGFAHTGVTLSDYTGSYLLSGVSNLVIDSKLLTDRLELSNCPNFTVKRSHVHAGAGGTPDGVGNIHLSGTSWGLIEDVEISCDPDQQFDRSIATWERTGTSGRPLQITRVHAHGGYRGMDITTDAFVTMDDCYMAYSEFIGTGERSHTSAVRAAGGVHDVLFRNTVFGVGADSNGSGVIATYPENGPNHHISFEGGLWILRDQGGGDPFGIAAGYTIGSEPQNHDYSIVDLYVSTEDYPDGCPGGVGQHWANGGVSNGQIGALGGTNVWTNVRKYHPGFPDHDEQIDHD